MLRLILALALALLVSPAAAAPSAPALTLRLLDGSNFDSRNLIGKQPLVVRFQASWCKVCAEEAPTVERIWQKYKSRGVMLVAVHVQDTAADARRFLSSHGATYPAGLDPRATLANRFGMKGTPYTVVINKRGDVVARISGRSDEARLARAIEPLVKPTSPKKPPKRLE